jgi:hypothetical protein
MRVTRSPRSRKGTRTASGQESPYTPQMRNLIALVFLLGLLLTSGAQAASYLKTDGAVVDPIQSPP